MRTTAIALTLVISLFAPSAEAVEIAFNDGEVKVLIRCQSMRERYEELIAYKAIKRPSLVDSSADALYLAHESKTAGYEGLAAARFLQAMVIQEDRTNPIDAFYFMNKLRPAFESRQLRKLLPPPPANYCLSPYD